MVKHKIILALNNLILIYTATRYLFHCAGILLKIDLRLHLQGVLSEILSGKRKLTLRQVKALGTRFTLPPAVFIDDK